VSESALVDERIRELEARLAGAEAKLARAHHERDEYRKLYELVMLELERVKRHLRVQNKSERVDAAQVQLAFAEVAPEVVVPPDLAQKIADDENEDREKQRKRHGRKRLPEHLPVERVELHPPAALRQCASCGNGMHPIGEETSEKLDWRPASLVRLQTARVKYACACEQGGVVIADVPDAPIERGLAGPGMLAHVVVAKYDDHVPLYRLEQMLAREGVEVSRSTMGDWVEQTASLLEPIAAAMALASLSAHRIHTDDTGIPVLDRGTTRRGHVWVYLADDDHVVFRYTLRRKAEGPREYLHGYKGYVQADAANLYDRLFGRDEQAIEVGCWAHARRRFVEAELTDRARALIAIGFIKKLYEADRSTAKLPPGQRTVERQARAGPVLDIFRKWLDREALVVLPKAPIAEAIGYVRNQWDALTRFLDDWRLRLDNNPAERQLRRVAIGRKNWLFAGSEAGAERTCILYTILASCRLHGVNPYQYLRDVLVRVGSHPARDVLDLAPKAWKQKLQHSDGDEPSVVTTT
jgi:transposase